MPLGLTKVLLTDPSPSLFLKDPSEFALSLMKKVRGIKFVRMCRAGASSSCRISGHFGVILVRFDFTCGMPLDYFFFESAFAMYCHDK